MNYEERSAIQFYIILIRVYSEYGDLVDSFTVSTPGVYS